MKIDVMKQSGFNAEQCFMDVVQQAQGRVERAGLAGTALPCWAGRGRGNSPRP